MNNLINIETLESAKREGITLPNLNKDSYKELINKISNDVQKLINNNLIDYKEGMTANDLLNNHENYKVTEIEKVIVNIKTIATDEIYKQLEELNKDLENQKSLDNLAYFISSEGVLSLPLNVKQYYETYHVTLTLQTKLQSDKKLEDLQTLLNEYSVSISDLNLILVDESNIKAEVIEVQDDVDVKDWESL